MINNIMIYGIIGIVIVAMVVVVLLYRKRASGSRIMKKISRKNTGNEEEGDVNSEGIELIEKIVHEAIPALRDDYMKQISTLNERISKIETDISSLKAMVNTEEKPKEEEVAINIIGIETEKGIELIFLSEDIKVPKRLIPNAEEVQENIENIKEGESHLSNEELEKIIIDSIKNGNATFSSISRAIQEAGEKVGNIKLGNILRRLIESGKVVKNDDKTYGLPQK